MNKLITTLIIIATIACNAPKTTAPTQDSTATNQVVTDSVKVIIDSVKH